MMAEISDLLGKTLKDVRVWDKEQITFITSEGQEFIMHHEQNCCESVYIDDVVGDISDLIGSPILMAEQVSSDGTPPVDPSDGEYGSFTWTFYKLATIKGYIDIKWYGSSNGYYSESVDFHLQGEPRY